MAARKKVVEFGGVASGNSIGNFWRDNESDRLHTLTLNFGENYFVSADVSIIALDHDVYVTAMNPITTILTTDAQDITYGSSKFKWLIGKGQTKTFSHRRAAVRSGVFTTYLITSPRTSNAKTTKMITTTT